MIKYSVAATLLVASSQAVRLEHKHHHKHHEHRQYEPEWGHNSGNSYDNGPTDHFYHGKASPYSVTKDDGLALQVEGGYEPEWGHNSGNSYNNGPTTHFYHGKASPFNVNNDDGLDV